MAAMLGDDIRSTVGGGETERLLKHLVPVKQLVMPWQLVVVWQLVAFRTGNPRYWQVLVLLAQFCQNRLVIGADRA